MPRRGRRGDGTVYWSKADRRWVARLPLGTMDGRRRDKREKCLTEDDAKAALKRLRRDYAPGRTTDTLGAWLREWLPAHARSIRESTAVSYAGHVRHHIDPLLGGIPLPELGPADVRRLIADLEGKRTCAETCTQEHAHRTMQPETIRHVVRTLSAALNAAVRDGLVARNVTAGVRLPRVEHPPVEPMRPATAEAVIDAVAGTWIERPVRVLLGSGMRLGEVMGLNQGDLLPEQGFVRIRVSKTQIRAVPVSEDAVAALREAVAAAPRVGPREPVFYAPKGTGRMLGHSVGQAFSRLVVAAGLPRLTVHSLRHGVATMMLADGTAMKVIQEQLGHRSLATTSRFYAHVVPEMQRTALTSLPRRRVK